MDQFTITKSAAEDSLPLPSPDLLVQQTDGLEDEGVEGSDDALVSKENEDI